MFVGAPRTLLCGALLCCVAVEYTVVYGFETLLLLGVTASYVEETGCR